jgi:hypothetical protein
MAFKTDLESLEPPTANGSVKAGAKEPIFDPMRRKLHMEE